MTLATSPLAASDIRYTDADFRAISAIAHKDAGLSLSEASTALVFSRLARYVRELGMSRFSDYITHLNGPGGADDRAVMVEAITTHTTRFFREPYHFDILARDFLPAMIERAKRGHRVRLWSAGCSSGEEAFSIAATVLAAFPDAGRHDLRILATDIDRRILSDAEAGLFKDEDAESVPADLRKLLFEPAAQAGMLSIRPAIRALVTFRRLNFIEPWPVRGPFDAIFCRNVAIYMDDDVQARLWGGLESVLGEKGLLCIGHSERIGPEFRDRLQSCGLTAYRRV
jgi:chemotaxis protein methyltransferase CheR